MSNDENVVDAGQGGDAGGSSPPDKEVAGLRSALQAERGKRQTLETQLGELKGTVDTLKQTQTQPKEHTRADLQAAVDAGRISQVDADRTLEQQQFRRVKAETKQELSEERRLEDRSAKINTEIDRYRQFKPEIETDGSEERNLVQAEYSRQINDLGKEANIATELDALTAVFGPASKLQTGRQKEPETHEEVGGDGGGEEPKVSGKPAKGLSAGAKRHYEKQIESGMYPDWAAVNKELENASPNVKRRLGVG